jgi:hypothetical protein
VFGLDWAWGEPSIASLKNAGVHFGVTYISHDKSKDLTKAEAEAHSKNGIHNAVVFETSAGRALQGKAAGVEDAKYTLKRLAEIGAPEGSPAYFAVDVDTTADRVSAYFSGVRSVLGKNRTGAYGGYKVISGLLDKGLIKYGWQTYAWSYGKWDRRAQLQQYSNGHYVGGVSVDYDRAVASDYGQWHASAVKPPTPPEPTKPPSGHGVPALWITSPYIKSRLVLRVQRSCNRILKSNIDEDAEFGPQSLAACVDVAFKKGVSRSKIAKIKREEKVPSDVVSRIVGAKKWSLAQRLRARKRKRDAARTGNGPKAAISWANSKVGITEVNGSNRGPEIDQWQRAVDMIGQPWCGAFVHAASKLHSSAKGLTYRTRYVPSIVADARAHSNGYRGFFPCSEAKPGDHVCFNFGTGTYQHVGLVVSVDLKNKVLHTIEGNTSFDNRGSQSNGGAVAKRTRAFSLAGGVARPAY